MIGGLGWVLMWAVLLGALVVAARRLGERRQRDERRQAARDLPAAVSDVARSIRSGATLGSALREVAPTCRGILGRELGAAVSLLDRGYDTTRVLQLWRRATVIDGVELVASACRFSVDHGAGLVGSLDGVAATLLDRIEVADETAALAAQARTSAVTLIALPPVGAAVFALVDPSSIGVLLGTTVGRVCLVAGVGLDLLGARISGALVQRAVRDGRPEHR